MSYYAKTQNQRLVGYYKIYNVQLDVQSDVSPLNTFGHWQCRIVLVPHFQCTVHCTYVAYL